MVSIWEPRPDGDTQVFLVPSEADLGPRAGRMDWQKITSRQAQDGETLTMTLVLTTWDEACVPGGWRHGRLTQARRVEQRWFPLLGGSAGSGSRARKGYVEEYALGGL